MFRRQRGVTFIGWIILLVPTAVLVYLGIRLAPIYLNYMRVAHSIEATASELKTEEASTINPQHIRATLSRHFDVESIDFPDVKDISVVKGGDGWTIEAKFEDAAPLFGNISLIIDFDKVAKIG